MSDRIIGIARRTYVEGCVFCEANQGRPFPPHDASPYCENPKPYKHCTCDVCY